MAKYTADDPLAVALPVDVGGIEKVDPEVKGLFEESVSMSEVYAGDEGAELAASKAND